MKYVPLALAAMLFGSAFPMLVGPLLLMLWGAAGMAWAYQEAMR